MTHALQRYEQLLREASEARLAADLELARVTLAGNAKPANQQIEPLLTTKEVAKMLSIGVQQVKLMVSRGTLVPAIMAKRGVAGGHRFERKVVERLMDRGL